MTNNRSTLPAITWAILVMGISLPLAAQVRLALDLSSAYQLHAKALPGGGYEITTTGKNPSIWTQPIKAAYDPAKQCIFAFAYFSPKQMGKIQLFFGKPASEQRSATGPAVFSSEGWSRYAFNILTHQKGHAWRSGYSIFRINFGHSAGHTMQLRKIELRQPAAAEMQSDQTLHQTKAQIARFNAILQAMVDGRYNIHITQVDATKTNLQITIDSPAASDDLLLCEVPLYQSPVHRQTFVWQQPIPAKSGEQTIDVDRMRGSDDRVFSSWIVMRKTDHGLVPASHQHFVDHIPSKWKLKREHPLSKKGLSGLNANNPVQVADYKALGIHNATKNIVLPRLVKAEPGDDTIPYQFNGITVYIDRHQLEALDRSMTEMERLKVVVSAIILIPPHTPMSDPNCTPQGIYAMPDVLDQKGWNIYAAGLDLLAHRYMRPDRKYGRITHWILQNEIDSGWVWTNAGNLPMDTYFDLYYRSMRTAQAVIRRYGNAGCVLMSLTHFWTARNNGKSFPPKALVDLLDKRSREEGNFDWGLAYHPYPQDLRNPKTWLDNKVTYNFNTPLITPKNLEVLDAYMHQRSMLYHGKVRTVVLSEQNANSPRNDKTSYRNQAAAIVYTWLKFQNLDSIESYVMHRWMDNPHEGGLHLGLRTYSKNPANSRKKLAYDVYRQLGTPQQPQVVKWAKTVIPAKYWKHIPATVHS